MLQRSSATTNWQGAAGIAPGLLLCLVVGGGAQALGALETAVLGRAWLEPLVLAILLGAVVRSLVDLPQITSRGIRFSAKTLLDCAVALLGASLSISALESLGLVSFLLIAAIVLVGLTGAFMIGRLLGLERRLAMLIAAGNAICGNSAIAAVAPVIGARDEEIASAISLTALTGVALVLVLPTAVTILGMPLNHYALLTGLTVYAVPQVIAAAAPFGTPVVTLATFIKLARVLLLGPVTFLLSLAAPLFTPPEDPGARAVKARLLPVPWFIIAFLLLAGVRWIGLLPPAWVTALGFTSNLLAVIAMAALGFGVRLQSLLEVGPRVTAACVAATGLFLALAATFIALRG